MDGRVELATYAGGVEQGADEKRRAEALATMDEVLKKEVHVDEAEVRVVGFNVKRDQGCSQLVLYGYHGPIANIEIVQALVAEGPWETGPLDHQFAFHERRLVYLGRIAPPRRAMVLEWQQPGGPQFGRCWHGPIRRHRAQGFCQVLEEGRQQPRVRMIELGCNLKFEIGVCVWRYRSCQGVVGRTYSRDAGPISCGSQDGRYVGGAPETAQQLGGTSLGERPKEVDELQMVLELALVGIDGVQLASQIDIFGPGDAAGRPVDAVGAGAQAGGTCRFCSVALVPFAPSVDVEEDGEATYALLLLSTVVAGDKGEHAASLLILDDARGGGRRHAIDLLLHIELVGIGVGVGVGICDPPSDRPSSHGGPVHHWTLYTRRGSSRAISRSSPRG
jgi:hypothetical protein